MMVTLFILVFVGGCNPLIIVGNEEAGIREMGFISINNMGGYFRNNGNGSFSFGGICKGGGEVRYRVGAGTEQTVPCRDGMWEVSNIIPTLSYSGGGARPANDGDEVSVEVSFNNRSVNGVLTVDRTAPIVEGMSAPENGTYSSGFLDFMVRFNENVFVNTDSGVPALNMILESGGGPVEYLGGSGTRELIFRYSIQSGDTDQNGILLDNKITLNSASIKDQAGNDAVISSLVLPRLNGLSVDTTAPRATGLTDMSGQSTVSAQTWSWGCYDAASSTPCSYRYTINQNRTHTFALSNSYGTTPTEASKVGGDGLWYLHIQIKDSVDNESSVFSYGVNLDSTPPQLVSENIGIPSSQSYSDQLDFTVKFSEVVTVETGSGVPRLVLTVGTTTRYANYVRGSGGTILTFSYVIQVGDVDNNGIALAPPRIDLNSGIIRDGVQNVFDGSATLQMPSLSGVHVNRVGGVTISETTLTVGENAQTESYTVILAGQPTGTVTVNISSGDRDVVTVDQASLSFSTGDWNRPKTVIVRGVNDNIDNDPDRMATISHTVLGGGYDSLSVDSVVVTATDDDTKGVGLSETGLTIDENSGRGSYEVVLNSQPTGNVTVNIAISGTGGVVSLDTSSLTFTSSTWNSAKTVTVTGVDDKIDSDRTTTISHTLSATGTDYETGVTVAGVAVTLTDDDTKGVSISETGLTIDENSGRGSYEVVLNSQPSGNVTVNVAISGAAGVVSLDTGSLTFTSTTWNNAKTVTVTGVDDKIDSDRTTTISHTLSASGTDYQTGVTVAGVAVTLTDDDTKGITVSTSTPLTIAEDAGEATYTLVLNSQPSGDVTVNIASGTAGVVSLDTSSLTFNSTNWNNAKTVRVTGVNDDIGSDRMTTISHTVSAPDTDYLGVTVASVSVTLIDDDTKGITVSTLTPLSVAEDAGEATYTWSLIANPREM